ncbi:MAG: hypothetical protein WKH64_09280 [Chloroflexia bacterium]
MANRRSVRPEVVVAGDPGRASHIAGMLMRQDVPVASYVPDYAGGGSGGKAFERGVIVETLDYPVDAKRALLEEIAEAMRPGTFDLVGARNDRRGNLDYARRLQPADCVRPADPGAA